MAKKMHSPVRKASENSFAAFAKRFDIDCAFQKSAEAGLSERLGGTTNDTKICRFRALRRIFRRDVESSRDSLSWRTRFRLSFFINASLQGHPDQHEIINSARCLYGLQSWRTRFRPSFFINALLQGHPDQHEIINFARCLYGFHPIIFRCYLSFEPPARQPGKMQPLRYSDDLSPSDYFDTALRNIPVSTP
ncbi:hypothetical protein E4U21_001507 [Claviceps maximensis]|nr:hypothetical protein E4U21_001507 [Claviceps maximensis]